MRNSVGGILLLCAFLLTSCDPNGVFDQYQSIPNSWDKDSVISFKVKPPDSLNPYNLFVNLRNNNDYKYNNLFLIVELNYPHGKTIKDTLLYKMAKPNGEFLGSGFSSLKENKFWYKENFTFNESGEYIINIQHAMREYGKVNGLKELGGITDVGFRIERINNQ
jgi:gliding motility-associated lipoprotein GldH